ncbi:MAG: S8 family serine peptidase [Cytophagia bacterium]|nr:S8 family serine peptidase [Cytophagia bacterium]
MRKIILLLVFFSILLNLSAQQKYRVYFKDKAGVEFNPEAYFDQKAIDRRIKHDVSLYDQSDFPLNQNYVGQVREIADAYGFESRWFNFVLVDVSNQKQLDDLRKLDCVAKIEQSIKVEILYTAETEFSDEYYDEELMKNQTERFGGSLLKEKELDGTGVRIAIFDGGFPEVNTHPSFTHIINQNRLVATWDFIKNKENVFYGNNHGRMTFACVGGFWKENNIGLATGAEYMLAKTEIGTEPFAEEEYWMAAAEWADKNGADIINSSLGYGHHRYFTNDMDGKTSLVVKAAHMAARKGILVVNSAGNEATDSWETIITPADGDSVLAVGGIDPDLDYHISFSSYGPTADKRMKPNVSAFGHVVTADKKGLKEVDGTSFSSPLTAGFAACILQHNPGFTNMDLFYELEKSGHLYPYFDYAHGYGVPQASYFLDADKKPIQQTFEFIEEDDKLIVRAILENYNNKNATNSNHLLYYNMEGEDGILESYYVVEVSQEVVLEFDRTEMDATPKTINVHFRGFSSHYKF